MYTIADVGVMAQNANDKDWHVEWPVKFAFYSLRTEMSE